MKILFITGTLGSGKTTLLIAMLKWLRSHDKALPPVIVNDRGTGANLDFMRVKREVEGISAEDMLGQCIGCGGRKQFLSLVRQQMNNEQQLLLVEPTGLFTLEELGEISRELPGCSLRSIHLLPQRTIQEDFHLGAEALRQCRVIGMTHVRTPPEKQMALIAAASKKPTVIIEQQPDAETLAMIWKHLIAEESKFGFRILRPVHSCGHHACTYDHGNDNHHHDDDPHCITFSTKGWSVNDILSYLLSLGDNLVRFKAVVEGDDGNLMLVQWAHGTWNETLVDDENGLKADLFTVHVVAQPNKAAITAAIVDRLLSDLPPVYRPSPITGKAGHLQPIDSAEWRALELAKHCGDIELLSKVYQTLIDRCRDSLLMATAHEHGVILQPDKVGMYIVEGAMLLAWLCEESSQELERDPIKIGLERLSTDRMKVDLNALKANWSDPVPRFLQRLLEMFLEHREMLQSLINRC